MTVRTTYDDVNDLYELGDDVDGVFVSFASQPGTDVRARVEQAQAAASGDASGATPARTTSGNASAAADARDARIAELESELAKAQAGGATTTPAAPAA